jgi:hypothetical protein
MIDFGVNDLSDNNIIEINGPEIPNAPAIEPIKIPKQDRNGLEFGIEILLFNNNIIELINSSPGNGSKT